MKAVSALLVLTTAVLQQTTVMKRTPVDMFPRGAWHREVVDTSPFASEEIKQIVPKPGGQFKISVQAVVHNLTGHELVYVNPAQYYDVYNNQTGKRAVNKPTGCYTTFFLDCFEPSLPPGTGDGPPKDVIPPHGSITDVISGYLDMDWELPPGTYTVVGIYCARQREGPECFKSSNKIQITIPEPVK